MDSQKLAEILVTEIEGYPSMVQNTIKGVLDLVKNEIKEGKILLSDWLESEDKFFEVIAKIIDLKTNTGIVDPFDFPYILKFVKRVLEPILIKAFGEKWLEKLREILA